MLSLFIDSLTTIDCSFFDRSRGLVGESWIVDIKIRGVQDEQGMLMDFADVKREIKHYIDHAVDHRFLVPIESEAVELEALGKVIQLRLDNGEWIQYQAPLEATALVNADKITSQTVIDYLKQGLAERLTDNIIDFDLTLRPEKIDGAYYHYSHGLKHHTGNCQRIVHGHRSKIKVLRNGDRDIDCEHSIAELFNDIYIATAEDRVDHFEREGQPYYQFAYTALQGDFSLSLPASRCYIMSPESTVENIAIELLNRYAKYASNDNVEIIAFEGVSKGAIASS